MVKESSRDRVDEELIALGRMMWDKERKRRDPGNPIMKVSYTSRAAQLSSRLPRLLFFLYLDLRKFLVLGQFVGFLLPTF